MAGSSFGTLFRITTFGESHGPGVGVIVEGATPGLPLCDEDIQIEMNRRKPGQSDITTPRQESDRVHIMSGLFEGHTTGTPIGVVLYNQDMRPSAYDDIRDLFRPGHADYTYLQKYGLRDYRGSGRASGRETAGRVAGGAIAKKLLAARGIRITAYTLRAAGIACESYDPGVIEKNPMRACDPQAAERMAERVRDLSIAIYLKGSQEAASHGILIADTKYEFGTIDDKLVLIDELLTPDSSRFWPADRYEPGRGQESFDKQYVRDYLETLDWDKTPPGPRLPDEIIAETSRRYIQIFERLTGEVM